MEIHGFNEFGSIDITLDTIRMSVPVDPGNRHYRMILEEVAGDLTLVSPYVPPIPVETPVSLQEIAGVRLSVDQDAWEVTGVERSRGIAGAFLADTDTVWVFFNADQPDTDYLVIPDTGVTKYEDHVEVMRPGLSMLSFIVQRVQ